MSERIRLNEVFFYVLHPIKAIEAKLRQIGVATEIPAPPTGSTIEDFPNLPVSQAAALLSFARKSHTSKRGGIQLEDWSKLDQERMLRGKKPQGTPIHKNI